MFGDRGCGKSTIVGQLLYHFGQCTKKDLKKAKKATKKYENREKSEYAFLCDVSENDRKREALGNHLLFFETAWSAYSVFDALPLTANQNRFVRALGQSRIGALILEFDSDSDRFAASIAPQSANYKSLLIAHAFGIQHLMVCINKMDKIAQTQVDAAAVCSKCVKMIQSMLTSVGYTAAKVPIIPISGYFSLNLFAPADNHSSIAQLEWWNSFDIASQSQPRKVHKIVSFVDALKYIDRKSKALNSAQICAPFCLQIKSKLNVKNVGVVYLGKVEQGKVSKNETILCCTAQTVSKYQIKSIQSHRRDIEIATSGQIIGFTLQSLDKEREQPKPKVFDFLCCADAFKLQLCEAQKSANYKACVPSSFEFVSSFIALLIVLDKVVCGNAETLSVSQKIDLSFRTFSVNATLSKILSKLPMENDNLLEVNNAQKCEVVMELKEAAFISSYHEMNSFSRFVVLKNKNVIAIGKVVSTNRYFVEAALAKKDQLKQKTFLFKTNLNRLSIENGGKTVEYLRDDANDGKLTAVQCGDYIKSEIEKLKMRMRVRIDAKADHIGIGFVTQSFDSFEVGQHDWGFGGANCVFFYSDADFYGSQEFASQNEHRLEFDVGSIVVLEIDTTTQQRMATLWSEDREDAKCKILLPSQFAVCVVLGTRVGTKVSVVDSTVF